MRKLFLTPSPSLGHALAKGGEELSTKGSHHSYSKAFVTWSIEHELTSPRYREAMQLDSEWITSARVSSSSCYIAATSAAENVLPSKGTE